MRIVRRAQGWLLVAVMTGACSLNPKGEDPTSLNDKGIDSGSPVFASGGTGAAGALPIGGGGQAGAMSGAGGATSQGGRGGAPAVTDGGAMPDAAVRVDAGPDSGTDGAPQSDGGRVKEAGKD